MCRAHAGASGCSPRAERAPASRGEPREQQLAAAEVASPRSCASIHGPDLAGRGRQSPQQPCLGLFQQQAAPSSTPSPSPCPPSAPGEVTRPLRGDRASGGLPMGERMGRAGAGLRFPRERVLCPALRAGPPHSQPHRTKKEPAPPCQGQPRAAYSPRPASQTAVALRLSEGLMINLPPRGHGGVRCAQGAPTPPPHPSRIAPQGSTVPTALGVAQPRHTAAVRSGGLESKEPGSPPADPQLQKTRGFCTRLALARHRPCFWERHELDLG